MTQYSRSFIDNYVKKLVRISPEESLVWRNLIEGLGASVDDPLFSQSKLEPNKYSDKLRNCSFESFEGVFKKLGLMPKEIDKLHIVATKIRLRGGEFDENNPSHIYSALKVVNSPASQKFNEMYKRSGKIESDFSDPFISEKDSKSKNEKVSFNNYEDWSNHLEKTRKRYEKNYEFILKTLERENEDTSLALKKKEEALDLIDKTHLIYLCDLELGL